MVLSFFFLFFVHEKNNFKRLNYKGFFHQSFLWFSVLFCHVNPFIILSEEAHERLAVKCLGQMLMMLTSAICGLQGAL